VGVVGLGGVRGGSPGWTGGSSFNHHKIVKCKFRVIWAVFVTFAMN